MWLGRNIEANVTTKEQEAEVRNGYAPWCEAYKNERKVSEQRLKRRVRQLSTYLGGSLPVIDSFWRVNKKSMMGRRKGG